MRFGKTDVSSINDEIENQKPQIYTDFDNFKYEMGTVMVENVGLIHANHYLMICTFRKNRNIHEEKYLALVRTWFE